jgi:predicted Rossmann fold nucleotide-binding protein DprA/Smf involved in DNA uptake
MNDSTRASTLLCATLASDKQKADDPLTTSEFHRLLVALESLNSDVAAMIGGGRATVLDQLTSRGWNSQRLSDLLAREAELDRAALRWSEINLSILSFLDDKYPARLRARLRDTAPPLLFFVGSDNLLDRGGLAIIGSRNTDDTALQFTAQLGRRCTEQDVMVISGGARGVDQKAMLASLDANGYALGILGDSLAREAVSEKYAVHIERGHLTLASSVSPEAPFSIGNAMSRNKLIYALSDAAFVVSANAQTGGTWHGAVENLKRRWTPLLVRNDESAPRGNDLLIRRGGIALNPAELNTTLDIHSWFTDRGDSDCLSLFPE